MQLYQNNPKTLTSGSSRLHTVLADIAPSLDISISLEFSVSWLTTIVSFRSSFVRVLGPLVCKSTIAFPRLDNQLFVYTKGDSVVCLPSNTLISFLFDTS